MGRVMALDVGSKTIGVAVSDPLRLFAQPVETHMRTGRAADARRIAELAAKAGIERLVVGLPIRTDGLEGPSAVEARRMAEAIRPLIEPVPIDFLDERFTTVEAMRALREAAVKGPRRKAVIDQVAAVLILQGWLDRAAAEGR